MFFYIPPANSKEVGGIKITMSVVFIHRHFFVSNILRCYFSQNLWTCCNKWKPDNMNLVYSDWFFYFSVPSLNYQNHQIHWIKSFFNKYLTKLWPEFDCCSKLLVTFDKICSQQKVMNFNHFLHNNFKVIWQMK